MSYETDEISKLKYEVKQLRQELNRFKRAIVSIPDFGKKVQKKLWEL